MSKVITLGIPCGIAFGMVLALATNKHFNPTEPRIEAPKAVSEEVIAEAYRSGYLDGKSSVSYTQAHIEAYHRGLKDAREDYDLEIRQMCVTVNIKRTGTAWCNPSRVIERGVQ